MYVSRSEKCRLQSAPLQSGMMILNCCFPTTIRKQQSLLRKPCIAYGEWEKKILISIHAFCILYGIRYSVLAVQPNVNTVYKKIVITTSRGRFHIHHIPIRSIKYKRLIDLVMSEFKGKLCSVRTHIKPIGDVPIQGGAVSRAILK